MVSLKWLGAHTDTIRIGGRETVCANCTHFMLHYVCIEGQMIPILRGHCMFPRIKDRNVGDSCPKFERKF